MAIVPPTRVLVVADGEQIGRAVAVLLGGELAAGVRTCLLPERAVADARSHRADVIVLALPTLAAVEALAPLLREPHVGRVAPPMLIALCDGASAGAAARLCRERVVDEYVQHFPMPLDAHRLAASVRLAARIELPRGDAIAASPAPPRRARVVVVEDDETLHALVAAMLDSEHVDLVFESDGDSALDRIQATAPDLVLMDVMLPGSDGVTITERLKATPALAGIPVVMLTGEARVDTLVRSMQAGAADFIVKPFTRDALLGKLGKFLPTVA